MRLDSGRYKFPSRQALQLRKLSLSLSLSLSSSNEALSLSLSLSSSKEALSQRVLKPTSSTLEVYKERSSVGSSQNAS